MKIELDKRDISYIIQLIVTNMLQGGIVIELKEANTQQTKKYEMAKTYLKETIQNKPVNARFNLEIPEELIKELDLK